MKPAFLAPGFLIAAMLLLLAGCGEDKVTPPANPADSAQILKKDCTDPKWKEQNLGLWYSVCRRPISW